jgi:GGDEF domain-containing protein
LLECELERARRRKLPLSVILFKLDSPDERIVREVARQGRDVCRLLDVLGTFGDRGVGILLPDTGPDGSEIAAQRVLNSYLSSRAVDGRSGAQLRVGVASHPEDGGGPRELLGMADQRAGGVSLLEPIAVG